MKIAGEYTFDAPQNLVWDAVQDPDVLGSVLPGGQGFEQVGENEYAGALDVKIGPVQGKFDGKIQMSDIVAPESYSIVVDGKGAPGFVKGEGSLKLAAQGDQTLMLYDGEAHVGGRIASVGQRLMDKSAESIIRQSLLALDEYLKVQVEKQAVVESAVAAGATTEEAAEQAAQAEIPEYVPPTQTDLAKNVARDVAGEMVPPSVRPWLIAAIVILVLLLLWWLFF